MDLGLDRRRRVAQRPRPGVPAPAREPSRDVLWLQRAAGNQAVAGLLARRAPPRRAPAVQRQGPAGSAAGEIDRATGTTSRGHELRASGTIAAGQTLWSGDGRRVHTIGDVRVTASVTNTGIVVDFSPSLTVTKENAALGFIDVDVNVQQLRWSFQAQTIGTTWSARNIVNIFGDPGGELLAAFGGALQQLPARTRQPGYDPFADPDIAGDLAALLGRLSSGGGSEPPRASEIEIGGGVTFGTEVVRDVGDGISIVVPAGTRFDVTAELQGGVPRDLASVRLAHARFRSSGGTPNVNLRALGQDWPVVALSSIDLAAGGGLSASYRIVHEDLGSAVLQLLAAAVVRENPLAAGEIRDDLTVRDEAAHRLVDERIHTHLEPALREAVLQNRAVLPGIDLAVVLGISG
jgi:hypothetical protein